MNDENRSSIFFICDSGWNNCFEYISWLVSFFPFNYHDYDNFLYNVIIIHCTINSLKIYVKNSQEFAIYLSTEFHIFRYVCNDVSNSLQFLLIFAFQLPCLWQIHLIGNHITGQKTAQENQSRNIQSVYQLNIVFQRYCDVHNRPILRANPHHLNAGLNFVH